MAQLTKRADFQKDQAHWDKLLLTYDYYREENQLDKKANWDYFKDYITTNTGSLTRQEFNILVSWYHFIRNNILKGRDEWANPAVDADTTFKLNEVKEFEFEK